MKTKNKGLDGCALGFIIAWFVLEIGLKFNSNAAWLNFILSIAGALVIYYNVRSILVAFGQLFSTIKSKGGAGNVGLSVLWLVFVLFVTSLLLNSIVAGARCFADTFAQLVYLHC
jgi:hypothetical protein